MTNRLTKEKSPYLKQHADNPVNWYPWGKEAFQEAKQRKCPIFLSIGYSTCYWCHMMEEDSFEDGEVADVLNEHFVAIKVDREERPDVDSVYMDAVVALTGQGGWPLSVFLTPDLQAFWGGTFFYKQQFLNILSEIQGAFKEHNDKVVAAASSLTERIKQNSKKLSDNTEIAPELIKSFVGASRSRFTEQNAPQFPAPQHIDCLLRLKEEKDLVCKTLDNMAKGGIFDHLAGGFHRYSVDETWTVPHFEKMLYDNAGLARTYLEAGKAFKSDEYIEIAKSTLEFIEQELGHSGGGFYAALDAGPVNREGEYYVWEYSELEELAHASDIFELDPKGNFEDGEIVLRLIADLSVRKSQEFKEIRSKLLEKRKQRTYPHLDHKIIVSWNALTISSFIKAYKVLQDQKYLEQAKKSANFLLKHAYKSGKLHRHIVDETPCHTAVSEDYIFLIQALLDLYEVELNPNWLNKSEELQRTCDHLFWKDNAYIYSAAPEIPLQKKEFFDHVLPSPNSIALGNLSRLSNIIPNSEYAEKLDLLKRSILAELKAFPAGYPTAFKNLLVQNGNFVCQDDYCVTPIRKC